MRKRLIHMVAIALIFALCGAMVINGTMTTSANSADKSLPVIDIKSNSPLITLRVIARAGSAFDPPGKEGLASLTAKMINEGGNQSLTYTEILKKFYPMAATCDAQVDKEIVVFIGEVHKDHLENFYPIFAENILKPRFDQGEFERLRSNAINRLEKSLRGNNDEELGKQALEVEIFQGHPFGHAIDGTVQGLKHITLEDVKGFYKTYYNNENLLLGAAGDLPDQFVERMAKDFHSLPAGKAAASKFPAPASPQGMEITLIEKETRASAISLGFPINLTRKDPDFYAMLVANSYFGEHRTFAGLLMQEMRVKRGLNYGDYSYIEHFKQDGQLTFGLPNLPRQQQYFSIWLRPVPNENRAFALRQAVWELERFINQGISEKEFEATRQFLLNYSNLWTQTLSRRLGYQLDSKYYDMDNYIAEIHERLPKLTVAQVNAAIKKYLNPHNIKAVVVTKDAEALKTQLLANAPSPIKYESSTPAEILNEDKEIEKYSLPLNKDKVRVIPVTQVFEN